MSVQTEINRISGEVSTQADLIAQIATALEGKAAGGIVEPALQAKTVTPSASTQTVTPDSGYDGLSQVTVNAMPTATQATPSITVSTAGKITATATQSAGYVASGTKSATKQLTTQAAQTITPGTSNKTIASGRYLTGTQTIKGDSNLVAGNIKSGVDIFGVTGTYTGGGTTLETCNVQITDASQLYAIAYTTVDANGNVTAAFVVPSTNRQTITCLCGSVVAISHYKAVTTSIKCTGCDLLYCAGVSGTYGHSYIKVSCDAGETAVFNTGVGSGTAGGSG